MSTSQIDVIVVHGMGQQDQAAYTDQVLAFVAGIQGHLGAAAPQLVAVPVYWADLLNGLEDRYYQAIKPETDQGPLRELMVRYMADNVAYREQQARIQNRLGSAVGASGNDKLLVGHSLGSVIAYDYLLQPGASDPIKWFVSMGSQIALWHMQEAVGGALNVRRPWLNIVAEDDIFGYPVAAAKSLVAANAPQDLLFDDGQLLDAHTVYWSNDKALQAIARLIS